MKRVKDCKDVSIMSPQDEQWRRTSLLCSSIFFVLISTPLCNQNINKQNVNIADETLTDYSFLSRYYYAKSKNYLKRRYQIRHWIPMFIGTPCMKTIDLEKEDELNKFYLYLLLYKTKRFYLPEMCLRKNFKIVLFHVGLIPLYHI